MPVKQNDLESELEQFKKEKENIRTLMGKIGGSDSTRNDKIVNTIFIVLLTILFTLDTLRHFDLITLPISTLFSLEIGIILISIKIIWLIEKQIKVNHFQFWILNSIEFRLNTVTKKLLEIDNKFNNNLEEEKGEK